MRFKSLIFAAILLFVGAGAVAQNLQAILDSGVDLELAPRKVYEIKEPLRFKVAGQKIYTKSVSGVSDYATLRLAKGAGATIIDGTGVAKVVVESIIVDGNRGELDTPTFAAEQKPLILMGGEGGNNQVVRRCLVHSCRSGGGWAAIHAIEYGESLVVEDNVVIFSGVDVLGNGRSPIEMQLGWADGVSTACNGSVVRNNLIVDATDEGVMVQGAKNTLVVDNVIVALSREMLAGVAVIANSPYARMGDSYEYDYRGVEVRGNLVAALGSRIHMGYALGARTWNEQKVESYLVGAKIEDNDIVGGAAAYGYVVNGVNDFTVVNNRSSARYSGNADGWANVNKMPDAPAAFIYLESAVKNSRLQSDFIKSKGYLSHVMRNFYKPKNRLGYRRLESYGEYEDDALVQGCYVEMLGRRATAEELQHWTKWLNESHSTVTDLRQILISQPEFVTKNGVIESFHMEGYRASKWLSAIVKAIDGGRDKKSGWISAHKLYTELFGEYNY